MLEFFKKVWTVLEALPAFSKLFRKTKTTGKIDPVETLDALSTISPSTKKCADTAKQTLQTGGGLPEVAKALTNIGEVEVLGQKLDTRNLIQDLRKIGGICGVLANLLDNIKKQPVEDVANMATAATNLDNWNDIIENAQH